MRSIPEATADLVFRAVDKDGSGSINKREFCDICGVIEYDFWSTKKNSPVEDVFPTLWASPTFVWFRERVEAGQFDTFMNCVLMVNLCLVIWESVYDLNGWSELNVMENLELSFSLVYVAEVGLNLCVYSWGQYWSFRSNQFDFTTTWLLLLSRLWWLRSSWRLRTSPCSRRTTQSTVAASRRSASPTRT